MDLVGGRFIAGVLPTSLSQVQFLSIAAMASVQMRPGAESFRKAHLQRAAGQVVSKEGPKAQEW